MAEHRTERVRNTGRGAVGVFFPHETDGTASEATAHHAAAEYAVLPQCNVDQEIHFGATDLVIVPQAGVGITKERAQHREIGLRQGIAGFEDPEVFADYVATSPIEAVSQEGFLPLQSSQVEIA
jgi:hypothetical protein